jgi:aromatic ring-cleaving dioxygenase
MKAFFSLIAVFLLLIHGAVSHPQKYPAHVGTQHLKDGEAPEILSWHIHVLFMTNNGQERIDEAMAFRDRAMKRFSMYTNDTLCTGEYDPNTESTEPLPDGGRIDNGRLCFISDHDISKTESGPFPTGEWGIFIPVSHLNIVVGWFNQNRGDLSVLLHPNSGFEYEDHSTSAMWSGAPWPLNIDLFTPNTRTNELDTERGDIGNPTCVAGGGVCGDVVWGGPSIPCCEGGVCGCDGSTCQCHKEMVK